MRKFAVAACIVSLLLRPALAADITIGLAAMPTSADPHFHQLGPNNALATQLYGALITTTPQLQPQPGLALSWQVVNDTTWRFALDPEAKFSDGTPFTADDVMFSLCRAMNGVGPTHSFTALPREITAIEIPDAHSIVLHTAQPDPIFLMTLSDFAIISAHAAGVGHLDWNKANQCGLASIPVPADFDSLKMAVGTGRYRLTHYESGNSLVMEPNPYHHGTPARWSRVTMRAVAATGARVAGLMAGDFDLIENPSAQDLPAMKQHGGIAWTVVPSNRLMFLQPDIARAPSPFVKATGTANPLQDARVREAISLAIDRNAIASRLMEGLAVPADQFTPPGLFARLPDAKPLPYDPARARALLAEAGWKDGFSLTLSATNNRYINDVQVSQAIAQFLTRVGIRTQVDSMTQTTFFPRRTRREFSFALGGWGYGTGEASTLLRTWLTTTDRARGLGGSNYGGWHDDAFDKLFLAAIVDMNPDRRAQELEQAQRIALAANALIPLYWETSVWAYKDRYTYAGRMDQRTDADDLAPRKQ